MNSEKTARPTDENFVTPSFYSVYVDNLDGGKSVKEGDSGEVEKWLVVAKATGQSLGVLYHVGDKSVTDASFGKTPGAEILAA